MPCLGLCIRNKKRGVLPKNFTKVWKYLIFTKENSVVGQN